MAALDDGLLHLALAHALDALSSSRSAAARPITPTSASRRTSAASSTAAARGSNSATWASTTTRSSRSPRRPIWSRSRSSSGGSPARMNAPIFGVEIPGFLFWVAVLYACFATGITQLIGRSLSRLYFPPAGGRGEFPLRPRAHPRIQRTDRAPEGRGAGDRPRGQGVRRRLQHRPAHHPRAHLSHRFNQFYTQISVIIPYVVVAPFYFVVKKVDFGTFNQAADAFGNVNTSMNFFVDQLHWPCRLQRDHPASHAPSRRPSPARAPTSEGRRA